MFSLDFSLHLGFTNRVKKQGSKRTKQFCEDAFSFICSQKDIKRPATIKNYITAVRSFGIFLDETAEKIMSAGLLQRYEVWLLASGIKRNTSSCYLRSLRAIYMRLYGTTDTLFENVFTRNDKTEKRAISTPSVQQLIKARNRVPKQYLLCYDLFVFSVYAFGIPFIDLAYLSLNNIVGSSIIYHRHKTGQLITVPIIPEMLTIINRYKGLASDGLMFPILTSDRCSYKTYQSCLSIYNRKLKELTDEIGLPLKLTSYVARHTWATLATKSGINIHHISQAMGHTNIRTTEIYLGQLSSSELLDDSLTVLSVITSSTKNDKSY